MKSRFTLSHNSKIKQTVLLLVSIATSMTVPTRASRTTAVDRKTCSHVVEGWWGNERAALCTPPWSVLRQALVVEHVDVAYIVVVGPTAKRSGTRSPMEHCANVIPINQLVESFEASNEEPIVTPPPPKYKLLIDEDHESANQQTKESKMDPMANENFENVPLSENDQEEAPSSSTIMGDICQSPHCTAELGPYQIPPTKEAQKSPCFRLIID